MIDRFWFQSVYFREPGGVLYELATLTPLPDPSIWRPEPAAARS
ncbi:MAG TPA: hypothetical protein VHW04_07790 [Solirubrobacteraceae bacterium]|nr:hypothetical protein [Solirubrobacteraceae bacterium]